MSFLEQKISLYNEIAMEFVAPEKGRHHQDFHHESLYLVFSKGGKGWYFISTHTIEYFCFGYHLKPPDKWK